MSGAANALTRPRSGGGAGLIAVGLGGLAALLLSVAGVNIVGSALGLDDGGDPDKWFRHAAGHILIGVLVLAIALVVARAGRPVAGDRFAQRGVRIVSGLAFLLGATQFVEAVGAYPPLDVLHIFGVTLVILPVLILGFLALAGIGLTRLLRPA